jgi:uncharacterized repeat protein (TIGR03803 family)
MLRKTLLMKRGAVLALLVIGVLLGAVWAQTETVLYSFCEQKNCTDGAEPVAGIVFDQKGNLYGTTRTGGAYQYCSDVGFGCGVVFKLTRAGKYTLLHTFCEQGGNCTDGANPYAASVLDPEGNLYGTTEYGGVHGQGVVFKLTPEGQYAVLHSFCARNNCTDGYDPSAGLALDQKGNLYGTTAYGGAHGGGVVFKLTSDGKYTVLHSFCQQGYPCTDGTGPRGGLVLDQDGNLYGTTLLGGGFIGYCSDVGYGCGVVFKLTPKGKATALYSFCAQSNCTDGASPYAGLVLDQTGNLYGTTTYGGANCSPGYGCGVVFKLAPKGKETVLYNFCAQTGCPDGSNPSLGRLVFDPKGNLYGTTVDGGTPSCNYFSGCGVVFKFAPKGKETVLYSFCPQWPSCTDGDDPLTGLVFDQKGNLYGTTLGGGHGGGGVFKLTP